MNCLVSVSLQRLKESLEPIRGMRITNNIMYPYRFRYRNLAINVPTLITKEEDIKAMGTLDSNYYSTRPGADTSITTVTTHNNGNNYEERYYPFSYLTDLDQEDASERIDTGGELAYNETGKAKTVNFPGESKIDVQGKVYNNSLSLSPYSSLILFDNGDVEPPDGGDCNCEVKITICVCGNCKDTVIKVKPKQRR